MHTIVASEIIQSVLDLIMIKRHLNGKKAKKCEIKDDFMFIENQDRQIFKTQQGIGNSFFNNAKFDNCIINMAGSASKDDREYLAIETQGKEVKIDKAEFSVMQVPVIAH